MWIVRPVLKLLHEAQVHDSLAPVGRHLGFASRFAGKLDTRLVSCSRHDDQAVVLHDLIELLEGRQLHVDKPIVLNCTHSLAERFSAREAEYANDSVYDFVET